MRRYHIGLMFLVWLLCLYACQTRDTNYEGETMYHFQLTENESRLRGTSKLHLPSLEARVAPENFDSQEYALYMARTRGSLQALFGVPPSLGDGLYEYCIEATDDEGNTWFLAAYHGDSGPAIGGNTRDPTIYPVAEALLQLIEETRPADFRDVFYDHINDFTLIYGCENGECYWKELPGEHN